MATRAIAEHQQEKLVTAKADDSDEKLLHDVVAEMNGGLSAMPPAKRSRALVDIMLLPRMSAGAKRIKRSISAFPIGESGSTSARRRISRNSSSVP
jgi:hypothetical protein